MLKFEKGFLVGRAAVVACLAGYMVAIVKVGRGWDMTILNSNSNVIDTYTGVRTLTEAKTRAPAALCKAIDSDGYNRGWKQGWRACQDRADRIRLDAVLAPAG